MLIANEWSTLSESVKALESRGVTFVFEPSPWEVHREIAAGGWFKDPEVCKRPAERVGGGSVGRRCDAEGSDQAGCQRWGSRARSSLSLAAGSIAGRRASTSR